MSLKFNFKSKKFYLAVIALIILILAGCEFARGFKKDSRVRASGTVEVTQVQLAPLAGGRIVVLNIKESDVVQKGDLIAKMSLDGADRDVEMANAALGAARQQLLEAENGFRREDIAKAGAALALRKTEHEQAIKDYKRFKGLAAEGVVSTREAELYKEDADAKMNAVKMAQEALNLLNNGTRPEQVAAAKENVKRGEAAVERAKIALGYKSFYAPVSGTILTKNYETGDVISAGAPIATLGKMEDCWVKLYIPSAQIGLIKLGGEAEVRIDAYPDKRFKAKVTEVNQSAEYNPRLSLTQSERTNMVFWIKISIDNREGVFKPGMPADVTIL